MKKSDLKTGMWVEFRDGDVGIVLLDTGEGDIVSCNQSYVDLGNYNDNLTCTYSKECDIIKIFKMSYSLDGKERKLLWEMSEPVDINVNVTINSANLEDVENIMSEMQKQFGNLVYKLV